MRRIILNLAVSLDGFIEGPNGEFDWCFTDQDYGMKEFLKRIDAILFGRKSYELLLSMEKNPYPTMTKYVFSNTLRSIPSATVIRGDVEETVRSIKKQKGKHIWLFGGATLTGGLMNFGLIDELQLAVHPLLLGRGKPLASTLENRFPLQFVRTRTYSTGLVQLLYRTRKHPSIVGR